MKFNHRERKEVANPKIQLLKKKKKDLAREVLEALIRNEQKLLLSIKRDLRLKSKQNRQSKKR